MNTPQSRKANPQIEAVQAQENHVKPHHQHGKKWCLVFSTASLFPEDLLPHLPLLHPFQLSEGVSSSHHQFHPEQQTPLLCDDHALGHWLVSDVL